MNVFFCLHDVFYDRLTDFYTVTDNLNKLVYFFKASYSNKWYKKSSADS